MSSDAPPRSSSDAPPRRVKHNIGIELVGANRMMHVVMKQPDGAPAAPSGDTSGTSFTVEMFRDETIENVKAKIQDRLGYVNDLKWEGATLPDFASHWALSNSIDLQRHFLAHLERQETNDPPPDEAADTTSSSGGEA